MVRATTSIASLVGLSSLMAVSAGGMIGQVVDSQNFCVFLPPKGEMDKPLSDNEWDSEAYCMGNTPGAKNANKLPDGFIQSAHYVATDAYVQVTGQFDPTKIGLNPLDDGGQCDVAAPKGSSCVGWKYYVNLIEPSNNMYCMRCCNDTKTCNRGISEKGCAHIIPGDYSGPMNGSGGGAVAPPTTTAKSTPTHTSSKASATSSSASSSSTTTPGSDGSNGSSGSDGSNGSSGSDGSNGSSGSDGSKGSSGSDGSNGSSGSDGSNGSTGSDGSKGSSGSDGSNGSSGSDGSNGSSGSDGSNGSTGSDGSNGSIGADGTEAPAPSSPSSEQPLASSSSQPSVPLATSSPAQSSASPSASASQSGVVGDSSVSAQAVSQASSLTTKSLVTGGLIALVGMFLAA